MSLLEKFQGYNDRVAMAFMESFDGEVARVESLKIKVTENLISKETKLSLTYEKYFKGGYLEPNDCAKFLKPAYKSIKWSKGVLQSCMEEEWNPLISALQRIVTCEGRYVIVFLYHIRLLLHFSDGREVNFPFFLRISFYKVVRGVQSTIKNLENSVCHHSLIKMLVVHELSRRKKSWEDFLWKVFYKKKTKSKADKDSLALVKEIGSRSRGSS